MNRKKTIFISMLAVFFMAAAALVYSIYSDTNFDIPNSFGDLAGFVDESAVAYAEAPGATQALAALRDSAIGRNLLEGALARDMLIGPVSDQIRFFSRKIQQLTGLEIGETTLARFFELPAALAIYPVRTTNRSAVAFLKVRTTDSIIASLAGKLGAALSGENGLAETKWKEKSIFSLGNAKQGLHFALVNDVLLVSPEMDLIKLSIRNASQASSRALPPDWKAFLARHPVNSSLLVRAWLRRAWLTSELPLVGLLLPSAIRAEAIACAVVVKPAPGIEASWTPLGNKTDAALGNDCLQQLPAETMAVLADSGFKGGDTWRLSPLLNVVLQTMPEDNRKTIEEFLKILPDDFALVFDGFKGNATRNWAGLRLVWNAGRDAAAALAKLEAFVASLPDANGDSATHHGVTYRRLTGGEKAAFDPCFGRIGGLIVVALDEDAMKSAIELAKGLQKQVRDTTAFTGALGKVRRESVTHFSHVNVSGLLRNMYQQMGERAFRSQEFSRREVAAVFEPILKDGPGFATLTTIAWRDQGCTRASLILR